MKGMMLKLTTKIGVAKGRIKTASGGFSKDENGSVDKIVMMAVSATVGLGLMIAFWGNYPGPNEEAEDASGLGGILYNIVETIGDSMDANKPQ